MQAYLKEDSVCIVAAYQDKDIIKAMGDYKWNKALKVWEFPLWKLPKLVDYLNLQYDTDVTQALKVEMDKNQERHSLINLANKIKSQDVYEPIGTCPEKLYEKLYDHQKRALKVTSLFDAYALFMETGTGKTLVAIRMIQLRKVPTLIVCPLSVIESVWMNELEKWAPELRKINLWEAIKKLNSHNLSSILDKDVYIINFESFKKMVEPEKMFEFLIIDESSKMKAPKTQITKKLVSLRDKIPYRIIMSGLPAPNDLLEYWAQMALINDRLLGDNYFRYRNIFFKSAGYGGFMYVPKRGSKETIMSKVAEQSFFVKKKDCLDLPERVFETRLIELDKIQREVYDTMVKQNIVEFKDNTTLASNELAKIMKLRQITSGFTITTENFPVKVSDNKLKILKGFITDELPNDEQLIIWAQFHWEIDALSELLGEDKSRKLYGLLKQEEKNQNIKDFQDGKVRFLIAHPKSGGMGLTFVNCSYMVWFSLSYSQEEHSQANDRIYRIGQKNNCTYIYILAKDTIDEVIYKALKRKQNLAEACLEMLKGK